MRLKILTTTFMIVGLLLILGLPWMLRDRPTRESPRQERITFARKILVYQGAIVVCLTATGVLAIMIVRQAREEYRKASLENLKFLMETTLQDHKRNKDEQPPPE